MTTHRLNLSKDMTQKQILGKWWLRCVVLEEVWVWLPWEGGSMHVVVMMEPTI